MTSLIERKTRILGAYHKIIGKIKAPNVRNQQAYELHISHHGCIMQCIEALTVLASKSMTNTLGEKQKDP